MGERKIDTLVSLMRTGDWPAALSLASKFPRLGPHGAAIKRAHAACCWPDFYRQLGRDPEGLVRTGIQALKERYGRYLGRESPRP